MDNNNWRPSILKGEPAMDTVDWRSQLPPDSRQKIVNKIMETLSKHLPHSAPEGINELMRIAARFEEKTFSSAVNQNDYLRKISMKMLTMETNSQNAAGASASIPPANNVTSMDSKPNNQGQLRPGTLPNNQSQAPQALMAQTLQSNTASGMTGSTCLPSSMPPVSSIANNNVTSVVNQNSNMHNVGGVLQDSSSGQHGLSSNIISGSQRQMMGRPNTMSSQQQQPQDSQYLYQQQQLHRQNFQSGNVPNHIQQQQQNVLQPNQMHSSQQPGIPTSATQPSAPLQGLHINQQSSPQLSAQQQTTSQSILRQHQSSLLRQHPQAQLASGIHQQQTSLPQQSISSQQQAQMMRQQAANGSGIQQKQMMGQHVAGDMQQQQHQQRLLNQQNNVMNMQQLQQKQHSPAQQQFMSQQNSLQATPQQPLGTQSNVAGLQQPQQQLLSSQVGNSSLQTNQQSVHMLSQPTVTLQRTHQAGHGLYPSQGQQSQNQPSQQQMMPLQSHHQQLQQPNLLEQDVQQRLQQSSGQVTGSLLPPQNVVDQQRQLYQPQRTLPEMPSSSLDSTAETKSGNAVDWQEEVYQRIKTMKEAYYPDLTEIYQRVTAKLQHDPLLQQQRPEQFEKLKQFKTMLERMMQFLSVSKSSIMPPLKNKVAIYEKQIIDFVTVHRPRKPVQQGQLPQSQMQQQSSQNGNHSHGSQANQQMQSVSMARAQQNSLENMQNNVLSSRPGASAPHQNIPSGSVPASTLESGQGNVLNNGQQVPMRSMQQNTYQQVNNSSASAQNGLSTLQSNVNQPQLSSSRLQQQKDQQMTQQQLRQQQFQQRQMQQQQLQKQQLIQQQQQQLQARQQVPQNDMNVSRGVFQHHSLQDQRATYPLQQLKPGPQLPVTSPQLLPGSSPQMTQQHLSPQVDQKNVISSVNKMGTPLQPANSPFIVPPASTPLAPSPMQVDSEKPSGTGMPGVIQSIAFGTPVISASPLLQEFISPDGNNLNPLASISGKSSVTELPIERLLRAVKSISPQSLSSAVSDIGSVVSMVDGIAGSAPGNGSRASVGEDFVAMTKCRLRARNFMAQEGMMTPTKKMKRHTTAVPSSVYSLEGSVGDNCKQFACSETSDLESTATSVGKKATTESEHALLEEIKEINQRLIDTVVEISDDEDAGDPNEGATSSKSCEGTIVRFSFIAVSLSPALKAHLSSTQMSPIQPLRLLVPSSYPNGSTSLLDKLSVETSKENEDLTSKAMAKFNILLRSLSQPMSLKEIATTWDACARTVICEYAQQFGGGTFSSKYGTWEKFVAAS